MFRAAVAARNALLACGPRMFQHGNPVEIAAYTDGMQRLVHLMNRLQARTMS